MMSPALQQCNYFIFADIELYGSSFVVAVTGRGFSHLGAMCVVVLLRINYQFG